MVIGDEPVRANGNRRCKVHGVGSAQPVPGGQYGGQVSRSPVHRSQIEAGEQPGQHTDLVMGTVP